MKICFVSNSAMKGYRSSGLVYALEQQGLILEELGLPESGYFPTDLRSIIWIIKRRECIWLITYPNNRFVFLLKTLGCKTIVLDAGWPVSDFSFEREFGHLRTTLKKLRWFLFDYLTFKLSNKVLLESQAQVKYCLKYLRCPKRKLFVVPTTLDEEKYRVPSSVELFDQFTILFRGRYNPESGVEVFLELAKRLRNKPFRFLLLCPNLPNDYELSPNVILDRTFHTQAELGVFNRRSHLVLGQLSSHPRLERTVPHRAVEAAYSGSIFVSARNRAISEFFVEGEDCLMFNPGCVQELSEIVIQVQQKYKDYGYLRKNIQNTYQTKFGPQAITDMFFDIFV